MAEVAFDWGPASLPDANDSDDYTLGVRFQMDDAYPIKGVEWLVPETEPVGTCAAALWADGGSLLASADFTVSPGEGGTLKRIYFDGGDFAGAGATPYRASIYTPGSYTATQSYAWPHIDGPLTATADNGYLTGIADFPGTQSGNGANFHVSPVIEVAGGPAQGSAAVDVALDLAAAGRRDSRGTAGLALALNLAAAGRRQPVGTAALGLALAVEAHGSRPSRGSADLTLALDVVARGGRISITRPTAAAVQRPTATAVPRPTL